MNGRQHEGVNPNPLHLLGKLNRTYALFHVAVVLICAAGLGALSAVLNSTDAAAGSFMAGMAAFTALLGGAITWLLFAMARRVEQGRWRIGQTILAALSLTSNPPAGTAYGAYALYVCWGHPAAKACFDAPGTASRATLGSDPQSRRFYDIARWVMLGFGAFYALLTVAVFVGVGALLAWGGQESTMVVTHERIEIRGMYGEVIERNALSKVELKSELPTITLRTNGMAVGNTLKGWFRTNEYGTVKLILQADKPPFIYLHKSDHLTIYGAPDPSTTERLYQEIDAQK